MLRLTWLIARGPLLAPPAPDGTRGDGGTPETAEAQNDPQPRKGQADPAKAGAAGLPKGAGGPRRGGQAKPGKAGHGKPGARQAAGAAAAAKPARQSEVFVVPPTARPARPRRRHGLLLALFVLIVVLPVGVSAWYLYARAVDQYASTLGFSVQSEEGPSASELLGRVADMSGGSSSDTDVLNDFIQSQRMVERVDARLDLRSMFTKPDNDPVFALSDGAPIEDLVNYWNRMVTIYYDGTQGLIEIRVLAFSPEDAQAIAQALFEESQLMINDLTAIARDDATGFARAELDVALERLKTARTALTAFRTRTQIVDPNADIQGQMGLLNTLQAQLAESLIELDLLRQTTRESDPRIRQTEQRISVIENRIEEERAKFGIGGQTVSGEAYADLIGEYESLVVDREFAEQAYLSALTNLDVALSEAQRQSRYLAAHIDPTLAQSSEYPRREVILALLTVFAFALWTTLSLIYYSIKDRR